MKSYKKAVVALGELLLEKSKTHEMDCIKRKIEKIEKEER